jgi:hypothetical protein
MQTTPGRYATLPVVVVLDVFVVPISIATTIMDSLVQRIHLIVNILCETPPLIIPFITTDKKRLWVMLRLVVNIAMR